MYQSKVWGQRLDTIDELRFEMRWCWWRCWWRLIPSRWEDRWWWRWWWFPPPEGKCPRRNSSAGALDWFRQGSASWRRSLVPKGCLWFFSHRKTSYRRRWASESHQGAHEVGGRAQGGGARPHPRGQGVGPLWYLLPPVFFINSKNNFREVSGLLELCRIGL